MTFFFFCHKCVIDNQNTENRAGHPIVIMKGVITHSQLFSQHFVRITFIFLEETVSISTLVSNDDDQFLHRLDVVFYASRFLLFLQRGINFLSIF